LVTKEIIGRNIVDLSIVNSALAARLYADTLANFDFVLYSFGWNVSLTLNQKKTNITQRKPGNLNSRAKLNN
jgi:hypothetical protein